MGAGQAPAGALGWSTDSKTGNLRVLHPPRLGAPAEQVHTAGEGAAPSQQAPRDASGGEGGIDLVDPEGHTPVCLSKGEAYRYLISHDRNAATVYANPDTNQLTFASLDYVHAPGATWGKEYRFTTFHLIQLEDPAIQVLVSSCTCSREANWPGEPGDRRH